MLWYLMVAAHVLITVYAVRAVCAWIHDRRTPRRDDVLAVWVAGVTAAAFLVLAAVCDLADGGRRLVLVRSLWEMAMLLCVITTGLSIHVMRSVRISTNGR